MPPFFANAGRRCFLKFSTWRRWRAIQQVHLVVVQRPGYSLYPPNLVGIPQFNQQVAEVSQRN